MKSIPTVRLRWWFGAAVPALLIVAACAINPATGKREFSLVSQSQEVAMGKQADPEIVAQFGLYPDDRLQAYVQRLGAELAAASERPDLPWTFRVLDDPLVNAFALPGGFIYVTRGILSHMGSEAELVGVLGHEIGHVTARHGASQMSKAVLAQLGLGLGSVLAPEEARSFGPLLETGLGLLFLKYGRDDERQADTLGLRYALGTGYNPAPMIDVFRTLERVGDESGRGDIPAWLSTHPAPENRGERLREQIAEREPLPSDLRINRDGFLNRLDGLVFGVNPRHGYFRDGTFLHPEMAFRFNYPSSWETVNTRQFVAISSPSRDAVIRLTLAREGDPGGAANRFFEPANVRPLRGGASSFNDLRGRSYLFEVDNQSGSPWIRGLAGFIKQGPRVYELLAYSRAEDFGRLREALESSLSSFRRLKDRRILDVQPMRLQVLRLSKPRTVAGLTSSVDTATVALINGVERDQVIPAGSLVKTVRGFNPERGRSTAR